MIRIGMTFITIVITPLVIVAAVATTICSEIHQTLAHIQEIWSIEL